MCFHSRDILMKIILGGYEGEKNEILHPLWGGVGTRR